ncbi:MULTISPECIES: extracellular solute-binding protein [unclassified Cryobacterium]|uniref:extracellular solute-binding protein n=1 Tax=unclassified Cryobacterium TaxID=2649013 RepID=UPI00106AD3B3|nr:MULTISPECIES: extracellular solute-binding protein [unclassified Cryobacterium]TFD07647.1 extracellular solute-binding protein [Cryobacterium sp. TMT1-66-1]TFD08064.1 extracellular solute-binding protein [Cryobacterium sp. TMT1-2-2]
MTIKNARTHRLTVGIGLISMGALLLSGCSLTGASTSSESKEGDGTGTINALFMKQAGYSEDNVNAMITDFESKNSEITVEPTFVAYEALHDKIVTSAPAGTYDVVHLDVIWPADFASKGLITDVTDRFPAAWADEMLGGALTSAEYQGKYYGAPWGPSTKLFYFNSEMVAAVGAAEADLTTWDGALAVAAKIKAAGLVEYPLSWSWSQAEALICDYAQLLGAFGGAFTDADGNLIVNDAAGVEALTWMKKTIDDGLTDPASITFLEDDVSKSIAAGKTAMALNWESTFRDSNDASISTVVGKVGVLPTPAGPSGEHPGVNGSMALSIGAQSTNQAAAWKFIEYMTSQSVQEKYVTSSMTNWKSSYTKTDLAASNPEVFAAAGVAYDSMILRPTVANYNSVSQILQVEIQNALLGQKTPQQAMDDAVEAANATIG